MHIQFEATKIYSLAELWMLAPEIVIEELTGAVWESEMALEEAIKDRTPTGVTSALRDGIYSLPPQVLSGSVIGVTGSPSKYAEPVELGTKPHAVSAEGVDAIEDWVRLKLGISGEEAQRVADSVAWKIRMRGTPAAGMCHRGLAYKKDEVLAGFEAATVRIVQRMGAV